MATKRIPVRPKMTQMQLHIAIREVRDADEMLLRAKLKHEIAGLFGQGTGHLPADAPEYARQREASVKLNQLLIQVRPIG